MALQKMIVSAVKAGESSGVAKYPYQFYAKVSEKADSETLVVNIVMPVGGKETGFYRFPRDGESVLVDSASDGQYYLLGYIPSDSEVRNNFLTNQPGGLLALTAFWSFGNLMPAGDQVIPPPPGLASNGLTQTLLLCALSPGGVRKVKERYAEYFRLGVDVLTGTDNWEASLADSRMPHERLPDPDWTKASDKSAAEWQDEAGIAESPDDEKEKSIARFIAESIGRPLPSPEAPPESGEGRGNRNENGNKNENRNANGNAGGHNRWKPELPNARDKH
ncbi:MAG: hypothetical protein LBG43_02895 [Treponema sp.]|jgi:hypothetical protein|nr:hypothetical protein [Treponema sp.]